MKAGTSALAWVMGMVVVAALALGPAECASAAPSSIRFVSGPVTVLHGESWFAQVSATFAGDGAVPVGSSSATVTVYASGVPEPIATGLPIQQDGSSYVTSPRQSQLPPGSYELTAFLVPAAGSGIDPSQTSAPLALEVTTYSVAATARVDAGSDGTSPSVVLGFEGEYVDKTGAAPRGSWLIRLSRDGHPHSSLEVSQRDEANAGVRRQLDVEPGHEYRLDAEFTPVAEIAPGLEVSQPVTQTFRSRDVTIVDVLATPIPLALWLLAAGGLLLFAGGTVALAAFLKRGRRAPDAASGA